jgi:hypothetical protein
MLDQRATYLIHCIVENRIQENGYSIRDAQLSSIEYRDIAAVVREVDSEVADQLESHEEQLRNWLASYQQTNIDIARYRAMLPLRFGTMVDSREEIEDFLSASYMHLKWALDRLRGKAEFAVHLSWDLNAVLQEISQDKSWLGTVRELTDKLELGKLLFQTADAKKKEIVDWVHDKLAGIALDSSDGRSADESIIMNRSYLIEKTAEGAFDEAMEELAQEGESYLSIKYVGPMPPYSFAPLEFRLGNFELIDQARRTLALPERAGFEDIRSSYRRLSLKYHPDKNPDNEQASERFRQIDESYKILESYCHSCEESPAFIEKVEFSFAKDDVEEVFVVERALAR